MSGTNRSCNDGVENTQKKLLYSDNPLCDISQQLGYGLQWRC